MLASPQLLEDTQTQGSQLPLGQTVTEDGSWRSHARHISIFSPGSCDAPHAAGNSHIKGHNSWHSNRFTFLQCGVPCQHSRTRTLGSKAYFPHLTFACISICQAEHTALQLFTHRQHSACAWLRCLPVTTACAWESWAGVHSPLLQLCQTKLALQYPLLFCYWHVPGGNFHCSVAFVREQEHQPFSYPLLKWGEQRRKLCPLQNLFPGNYLRSHMPQMPLPGSGEHSCTLRWAEMLKTISHISLPISSDQRCSERCVFEW